MSFFVVTYCHPDPVGWKEHLDAHLTWLIESVESGRLKASGPLTSAPELSAMLIIAADGRPDLDAFVATDPFMIEGQVSDLTVTDWDPLFGVWHEESSRPELSQPGIAT